MGFRCFYLAHYPLVSACPCTERRTKSRSPEAGLQQAEKRLMR